MKILYIIIYIIIYIIYIYIYIGDDDISEDRDIIN